MAILTISRQEGSFSHNIASRIAEKFNYPFIDREIIEKTLVADYGLGAENFNRYDEKKPSLLDSYLHEYEKYYDFLKLYLFNAAVNNTGCVILGRGGAFIFKNIPGAFRLRLTASDETRINRIIEKYNCDEKQAEKIIHHTDHDRNGFYKFFYGKSWNESLSYDMVLNTDKLADEAVSEIVTDAFDSFIKRIDEKSSKSAITDLLLSQNIKNKILYTKNIPVHLFEVKVTDSTATLIGTVEVENRLRECEDIAMTVQGVKAVNNKLMFIQHKTW